MYRRRIGLVSGVLLALVSPLWPAAAPASAALSAVAPAPVSLPATPGSETLDNNTAATATPIQSGARIRGEIDVKGDVDYYAFTAPADSRVYAAVITAGSNPSRDSVLWVIDTDGTTVLEADDDNGSLRNLSSSIAGTRLTDAGTYYLQVESLSAGGIFVLKPYDVYLQVQGGASDAENEPNDTQDRPTPIGDMLMTGVRSATPPVGQPDADFYSLDLAPGDTIFASLDLDPERDGVAWNGRLQFGPFGDDTTALQPADDPGTADAIPSEAYAMTVDRSGTFYAVVDAASADVGGPTATYGLSVTVIRAAAVSCRAYSATAGGQITDKGLTSFEIEVSDAARVGRVALDVDLTHPRMTDVDAFLRAPNGGAVAVFDDIGELDTGGQSRMRTTFDDLAATAFWYATMKDTQLRSENGNLANLAGADGQGTWTLELRDDTASQVGTLNGVTLILCPEAADPPTATTIFGADFEAGDQGFTHSGTADGWARGTPATVATGAIAGLDGCASGTSCWKTNLTGSYAPSSESVLVSPPIDLTGRSGTILASWQEWFQLESSAFDHYTVTVAEAGGAHPTEVATWRGSTMAATQGEPATVLPEVSGWHRRTADLSAYAGKVVRLTYRLTANATNEYAGVAIDDIMVTGPAKATPPSAPPVAPGSPATPTLSAAATRAPAAKLRASCGAAACTVKVASARVAVGGKALGKLIAPKQVELGAGATKRLKLKPTAAQHRAVTGRARVVINLKLIFTYADGRQVTVKRHLRA